MSELTVLTVLRGDAVQPEHVIDLRNQVSANLSLPHKFACLTDRPIGEGVIGVPFHNDWPRHYAKVEMFRPDFVGRILFMDLSCRVVGSLDDIASQDGICITQDFYHGTPSQSILLFKGGDFSSVYNAFKFDPEWWMAKGDRHRAPDFYDQVLMNHLPLPEMRYWQDVLPGQVVSWRVHCKREIPENARIIKFHGSPKPWELQWKTTSRGLQTSN